MNDIESGHGSGPVPAASRALRADRRRGAPRHRGNGPGRLGRVARRAVVYLLQEAVAERFPAAVIVQMDPIAATADEEVWYVFRDGRRRPGGREIGPV